MRCPLPVRRTSAALALCLVAGAAQAAETFDCVIEPSQTVLLGSPTTGVLSDVAVGRGDRVSQGQPLARIDARVEEATLALQAMRATDRSGLEAQEARLELARQRMARVTQLLERGAGTRQAYDEAAAELAVNEAELTRIEMSIRLAEMEQARAEAALALRTIESPVNGIVTERVLGPGEFVNQDAHILKIAVLSPLHVEVFLPVAYFPQISEGNLGQVTPVAAAPGEYAATVTVIDRVFDAMSNTFGVRLEIENPDGALPGGQRCRITLDVSAPG